MFPNTSYAQEKDGALSTGDKVQLKYKNPITNAFSYVFPAGTSIGWVLVSEGFEKKSSKRGSVGGKNKIKFYSISSLNPEPNSAEKRHCILLYDEQTQFSIIGFEDMLTTEGDNDYEDVLFYASANPIDAIEPPPHVVGPPAPVQTTYTTNYSGTLAFEDIWPYTGE